MSSKFYLKLKRNDEAVDDLPAVDENVLLAPPDMTRPEWMETANEVQVQYPERIFVVMEQELGRDTANPESLVKSGYYYKDLPGGYSQINYWYPGGELYKVKDDGTQVAVTPANREIHLGQAAGGIPTPLINEIHYGCLRFPRMTLIQRSTIYSARLYALTPYNPVYHDRMGDACYWYISKDNNPAYPSTGPGLLAVKIYDKKVHVPNYTLDPTMTPAPSGDLAGYSWIYWDVAEMLQQAVNDNNYFRLDPLMFVTRMVGVPALYPYFKLILTGEAYSGPQYGPFLQVTWQWNPN